MNSQHVFSKAHVTSHTTVTTQIFTSLMLYFDFKKLDMFLNFDLNNSRKVNIIFNTKFINYTDTQNFTRFYEALSTFSYHTNTNFKYHSRDLMNLTRQFSSLLILFLQKSCLEMEIMQEKWTQFWRNIENWIDISVFVMKQTIN